MVEEATGQIEAPSIAAPFRLFPKITLNRFPEFDHYDVHETRASIFTHHLRNFVNL